MLGKRPRLRPGSSARGDTGDLVVADDVTICAGAVVYARARIGAGHTAVKARLLNQGAIAGVGNLLADQTLWQARLAPARDTGSLTPDDLDRLRRELRAALRSAIRQGGVHTGTFVKARRGSGVCPRDGHALERGRVGGRTTYWCPVCQS